MFRRQRVLAWIGGVLAGLVVLSVISAVFIDEPMRRRMEASLNASVKGYRFRIGELDFHPVGASVTLRDLVVIQQANPDPPLAKIDRLDASVQWLALIHGRVVADFLIDHPTVHMDERKARAEARDPTPAKERAASWQRAAEAIYPFKVNLLRIRKGDVFYAAEGPFEPLHLARLNVRAENIRNVASPDRVYPSRLHVDSLVFDKAYLAVDGWANFLAEPHVGIAAGYSVRDLPLRHLLPVMRGYNLELAGGVLTTVGDLEYSPTWKKADVNELTVRDLKADYVHAPQTAPTEQARLQGAKSAAVKANNNPELLVRVAHMTIEDSVLGYKNETTNPPYRVFLDAKQVELRNFTNQRREGTSTATVRGRFQGSGETKADATFRPEIKGPDFDLDVRLEDADLRSLNDVLRAHGGFDVVKGLLSVYSEVTVREGEMRGYVKPLFKDVQVYSRQQDAKKGIGKQLYEGAVEGANKLLKNRQEGAVATKVDLTGRLDNPQTSTWQAVLGVIQNAFFKAILPGLERERSGGD